MIAPPIPEPVELRLVEGGGIPNHPHYPVLHYRGVFPPAADLADTFEALFEANRWPPQWRAGVYPFHHFHASAHEAFGIARGEARLRLGGEHGPLIDIVAGDALVLPAGTGHCRVSASTDFVAVGAYPQGAEVDMHRAASSRLAALKATILAVPRPEADPVGGAHGPLLRLWAQA